MTRVTSEASTREWLDHPLSHRLKQILQQRRDQVVSELLSGRPADPIRQGQGVALQWVCRLLDLPPDQLMEQLHQYQHNQQDRLDR